MNGRLLYVTNAAMRHSYIQSIVVSCTAVISYATLTLTVDIWICYAGLDGCVIMQRALNQWRICSSLKGEWRTVDLGPSRRRS